MCLLSLSQTLCSCEIEKENSFLLPNNDDDNDNDDDYNIKLLMDFLSTSQAGEVAGAHKERKNNKKSHMKIIACVYILEVCVWLPETAMR